MKKGYYDKEDTYDCVEVDGFGMPPEPLFSPLMTLTWVCLGKLCEMADASPIFFYVPTDSSDLN